MRGKNSPLVSVIMNCHNGQKFLNDSLKSLFKQSYKNWELIFFDNNSEDNSKKIVKSFKDKRIKFFFNKKKVNLYNARNLAIKKSTGKYISFLDVDDLWDKNKLKLQLNFLKKNKEFKILYSNYTVIDESQNRRYKKYCKNLNSGYITQFLLKNYSIGILTVLFEKKIIGKKCFNNVYNIIGDFDYFLRLSLKNKIAYMPVSLATYRIHDRNYSTLNLKEYINELKDWIKKNSKVYKKYTFYHIHYYLMKLRIKLFLKSFSGV